jgi:hypothetical protein
MFSLSLPSRAALVVALAPICLMLPDSASRADSVYMNKTFLKGECAKKGGIFAVEPSGAFSCTRVSEGRATNCGSDGKCMEVDTRRPSGPDNPSPRGDVYPKKKT